MADQILEACKATIEATNDVDSLQINVQQCEFLKKKLRNTRETLDQFQDVQVRGRESGSGSTDSGWALPAEELHGVVNSARALIADCCCEDSHQWLTAVIKQGDMQETFAEIVYDLRWCMQVLCSVQQVDPAFCDGKLDPLDSFSLSAAAQADKRALISRLTETIEGQECDGGGGCDHCLSLKLRKVLQSAVVKTAEWEGSRRSGSSQPLHAYLEIDMRHFPKGRKIGSGASGKVAEISWRNEKFALKNFKEKFLWEQEREVLEGLNHPHIARVMCCSENDNEKGALLMEFMEEQDLRVVLAKEKEHKQQQAPFTLIQSVDLMLQVAEGLKYVHSKRLAHRDVKSPNILMTRAPFNSSPDSTMKIKQPYIAKIADFGASSTKNSITAYSHQTSQVGTCMWKAPEVFPFLPGEEPSTAQPRKTDAYSFGIVCFEILTGEVPWLNVYNLHKRLRDGERPKLPDYLPKRLDVLIKRCWSGNPRERPPFPDICQQLRYIKALLLRGDTAALNEIDQDTGVTIGVQTKGPWGGPGGGDFCTGIVASIKRIKVRCTVNNIGREECICYFEVESEINGKKCISSHGVESRDSSNNPYEITIRDPGEIFTQMEVTVGDTPYIQGTRRVTGITSIKFWTSMERVYGPYGFESAQVYTSGIGKIVGFYGKCGLTLDQIGAFIVIGGDQDVCT